MKVSLNWLKELIDLKISREELLKLLPLRTIGLKDVSEESIELDMKGYNRADLLSLRGVAYEIAAITGSKVTFQEIPENEYFWAVRNFPKTDIVVRNSALCPAYCIAKIEGLKVEKSPAEWVKKLNDSGMRSVNNVADITNLIMLEYGQPLHSFDADKVAEGKIIVRTAKEGEEIVTLDNKTRKLTSADLLITDPEKAIGIAGVMGGLNSEITDSTTTIFLEAAIFDPINLRKTATRLGLQSEASKRFQHGLTKKRMLQALDAAINMYEQLGGKVSGVTIIGDLEDRVPTIKLTQQKINSLIGIEISPNLVESSLQKLGFKIATQDVHLCAWEITPPYFRLDIEIEEDIIEEVARMYGYEKIPAKELAGEIPAKIDQSLFDFIYNTKVALARTGLTEVQLYSFYSTQVLDNLNLDREELIKILNPMSRETEYMRDNLWPNLLECTAKNLKNSYEEVAIFEIGKTYRPKEGDLPEEEYKLALVLSTDESNTIQELYSIFQSSCSHIRYGKLSLEEISFKNDEMNEKEKAMFHPVRFAQIMYKDKKIGIIAEVHPRITNKFGIGKRAAIIEINLENLLK